MNITIVGFDYQVVQNLANKISNKLNLEFVDLSKELEKILLSINLPITIENEIFNYQESLLIQDYSNKNNIIISLPIDMFISNNNYNLLKNNFIIFINSIKINNFQKNIKKLIKNAINIEINQEKINFNEIINNIRGYYDR